MPQAGSEGGRKILELKAVDLVRDGRQVLSGISWTVRSGENWVVLGRNGSGKSSLLEIVAGYLWATSGTVEVLGEIYGRTDLSFHRRKFGWVAPWILKRFRPWERVSDAIAAGTEALVEPGREPSRAVLAAARKQLSFLGCLELENRLCGSLSTGELMKVALARARVASPRLLILDEPFASLDMGARFDLYRILKKIAAARGGPCILMVTHHLEEIRPFFTHALLLRKGRIFAAGPRRKVLKPGTLKKIFDLDVAPSRSKS
ncbi:MAG: ATP-binding cassette domain-containing protein [Candidatus Omnitrophica bacterium]|nr:ATP-binding cassette domain-containing protein [Candidatus Omnitrophota bacterium]